MEIRHGALEDLEDILRVEAECFPPEEAASYESVKERLEIYNDHFWLLEDGDTLVSLVNGMATDLPDLCDEMYKNAEMHDSKGAWQMIFGVGTIPAYRDRGCAGMVLNRVISDAREQGRRGLVLTCKEHLVGYYAGFGFISEGVSDSTHGGVVWYQMRLVF